MFLKFNIDNYNIFCIFTIIVVIVEVSLESNNIKLTIEELADMVNAELKKNGESSLDKRQSETLTVRRIRDYISKGLINKPYGSKYKWFDMSHVNALVSIRKLQHSGLSEKYIKNSAYSSSVEDQVQNDAMSFLSSLVGDSQLQKSDNINNKSNLIASSLSASTLANNRLVGNTKETQKLMKGLSDSLSQYTQYNEYCADKELGIFLKCNSAVNQDLQMKILNELKNNIKKHKGE